ncbi:M48 family metallopeptidase [Niveispirillum irakense]|uniref:M48 family metallopeptidase n=1 Tax=Niveispirillum irakense TaxID=34011 RepID=UPI0003F8BBE1|nr:SprT family zinc-dependent metalloprotease [Niveispirillum irakense]
MFSFLKPVLKPARPKPAAKRKALAPSRPRAVAPPPRMMALAHIPVPVEVRVSLRSRRLSMRVDPVRNMVRISTPPAIPDVEIHKFIGRHLEWLHRRLSAVPPEYPFADGAVVPILGVDHVIRHQPGSRAAPRLVTGTEEGPLLLVGGEKDFLARRVTSFLKAEAKRVMAERSRAKAALIGAKVASVTVRDTRSRWGSCSAAGRLSYCWRLILAPDAVLDYVVAHEVAHLREMNHSAQFWELCARLTPAVLGPRDWLRAHGARLHRYG